MRTSSLIGIAALALTSGQAIAQTTPSGANADTYRAILARGLFIVTPDAEIDVKFTPDGKFTAFKGLSSGVWRFEGEKLCSTPNETLIETCGVYPAGKKPGDTFEINAPSGRVTVRIP
jgi:hypothetical protein